MTGGLRGSIVGRRRVEWIVARIGVVDFRQGKGGENQVNPTRNEMQPEGGDQSERIDLCQAVEADGDGQNESSGNE